MSIRPANEKLFDYSIEHLLGLIKYANAYDGTPVKIINDWRVSVSGKFDGHDYLVITNVGDKKLKSNQVKCLVEDTRYGGIVFGEAPKLNRFYWRTSPQTLLAHYIRKVWGYLPDITVGENFTNVPTLTRGIVDFKNKIRGNWYYFLSDSQKIGRFQGGRHSKPTNRSENPMNSVKGKLKSIENYPCEPDQWYLEELSFVALFDNVTGRLLEVRLSTTADLEDIICILEIERRLRQLQIEDFEPHESEEIIKLIRTEISKLESKGPRRFDISPLKRAQYDKLLGIGAGDVNTCFGNTFYGSLVLPSS